MAPSLGIYDPARIERKWQEKWTRAHTWEVKPDPSKKKYYLLDMFPYPSGRLHMGHVRNYTLSDVIARFRRAQGHHVLHPMGWDAFGLPAENAAIKNKTHPEKWTLENIQVMKRQLERLGIGYDWSREVTTCLPEYYRWEQLVFTQMFDRGLAYRKASTVNWCPSCQTVLANEQVEDGRCWRCESEVTTRELEQWFLRTTAYAAELLAGLDTLTDWPERVKLMQRNWIGQSEGAQVVFALAPDHGSELASERIEVFTTRADTLFGVTYLALAPEHPLVAKLAARAEPERRAQIDAFVQEARKQNRIARTAEGAEKSGVALGAYALHPLTGERLPIYAANFVLLDYGTGALMAVPAHDERDHAFAKKYNLPIRAVVAPAGTASVDVSERPFVDAGVLIASGEWSGQESEAARVAIATALERRGAGQRQVTYRLRDWGLSRQRYWGAPIPIVYCKHCGIVPVPADQLPVLLPQDVDLSGEGGSPLAQHPAFKSTACPRCGDPSARRETDTMDTFMESSWYYLRYLSPKSERYLVDPEEARYWLGIDQYIGGIEHATMHLLYFRFFHRVLRDLGHLPDGLSPTDRDEPCRRLLNQGIVYKDGAKMSKSKGNVVEPDHIIGQYGADTARLFSMFAAPPEKVLEWTDQGVEGSFRFLGRVWRLVEQLGSIIEGVSPFAGTHRDLGHEPTRRLRAKAHQTIERVVGSFDHGYHFNTAISAIMELVNELYAYPVDLGVSGAREVLRESVEIVIRLLAPFAPHAAEELWEGLGHRQWLVDLPLPSADPGALVREQLTVVVQVNGKLRTQLEVHPAIEAARVEEMARADARVTPFLDGKRVMRVVYVPGRLINFVVQ